MTNAAAEDTRSVQKRLLFLRYTFVHRCLFSWIQNIHQGHQVSTFCGQIQATI